ncbi:MAG: tetratricopeptide repeat protein [Planctomycetes bacterium]|nr:tetratricopeptide repeat protein [Planctomycetota bacterium]
MNVNARRDRLFLAFFFGSGFSGLVYQVVWTRQAALALGNTTAAVGTVVAVFMGGLALGSALAGRWAARHAGRASDLLRAYAGLEVGIGAPALTVPLLFRLIEPIHRATHAWIDDAPAAFRKGWQASPGHACAGTGLAETLLLQDKPQEALDILSVVLRDHPEDAKARVAKARAFWKDGRPNEATQELDRVLTNRPDHEGARMLRHEMER